MSQCDKSAKRVRKDEGWKLDWPLGLVVMRSSETSLKVSFSPATRYKLNQMSLKKEFCEKNWGQYMKT